MKFIRKNKKRLIETGVKPPYEPLMKTYKAIKLINFNSSLLFTLVFKYMLNLKDEEKDVTTIYTDLFNIHKDTYKNADIMFEQSPVSQQLAIGRHIGIYKTNRDGKHIYYSLDQKGYSKLKRIFNFINEELKE